MKDMRSFETAAELLPGDMRALALALPESVRAEAEELRLRCGAPAVVLTGGGELSFGPAVTARMLASVLETASRASAHTAMAGVAGGFVTVRGGLRLGLCGEAAVRDGHILSLRYVSSVCIRLPREARGCADGIFPSLTTGGFTDTLILSPPGAGKTTLLRELVRRLSESGTRVALIDERGETAGAWEGAPTLDVGRRTDVMTGAPKREAAMLLLRSMSPQVMAMDEITSPEDLEAVAAAAGCGVRLLATCHARSVQELRRRGLYRDMLSDGIFRRAVTIVRRSDGGREYTVEELGT